MNNNSTSLLNSGVHQRKANTKSKTSSSKKKPIKVVYISNPMKVKTSASEFRALVQELTGQDSELPDPNRFLDPDVDDNNNNNNNHFSHVNPMVNNSPPDSTQIGVDEAGTILEQASSQEQPESSNSNTQYDMYNDVFLPEMIDNFEGLLPSTLLYESSSCTHFN